MPKMTTTFLSVSKPLGPSQVIPNSLGNLVCFRVMCKKLGIDCSFENFHHLFRFVFSKGNQFFYTFVVRPKYTFFDDPISSLGVKWWERFFFVHVALKPGLSEGEREKWGLPLKFHRADIQNTGVDKVPEWMKALHKGQRYPFHGLICQPLPFHSGLTGEVFCRNKPDFGKILPVGCYYMPKL